MWLPEGILFGTLHAVFTDELQIGHVCVNEHGSHALLPAQGSGNPYGLVLLKVGLAQTPSSPCLRDAFLLNGILKDTNTVCKLA